MSVSKVVYIPPSVNQFDEARLRQSLPSDWTIVRLDQAIAQAQFNAYVNSGHWLEDMLYLLHAPLR